MRLGMNLNWATKKYLCKNYFFDKLVDSIKQKENDFRKTDCNPFLTHHFLTRHCIIINDNYARTRKFQFDRIQGKKARKLYLKRGLLPMPTSHRGIALSNDFLQLVSKFYQDLEY